MGILLLAEIVERLTGLSLPVFLQQEVFAPLGMTSTSLGICDDLRPRVAAVDLPEEQQGTDWHWNSEYWRSLGAPWGGMFSTVGDLLVLLQTFLDHGMHHGRRVLSAASARTMVTDQTSGMAGLAEESRRQQRWGLGWSLGWCDLSSPRAFHHCGATGTMVGADPETGLAAAILTTTPSAPVCQLANALHGAVI
jgi:CubicO group peptidase (beta-lactamase class C family)